MRVEGESTGAIVERRLLVNGEPRRISGGSLESALTELGYRPESPGIALAHNGRIVHRAQWASTAIEDGDEIDIVGAVQGG